MAQIRLAKIEDCKACCELSRIPELAIADGSLVCVESPRGKIDIEAWITDKLNPGILSTTFHFPEVMVNMITSDVYDSEAMCPEYKVVSVRIRKSKGKHRAMAEAQLNK